MKKSILFLFVFVACMGGYYFYPSFQQNTPQTVTKKSVNTLTSQHTSYGDEVVFHRGNSGEVSSLDPLYISGSWEQNIIRDMFEGLVSTGRNGQATPTIAESFEISEDGLTYTFKMRKSAKWSNGEPITVDDVLFSLRRAIDPNNAAPYADKFYPIINGKEISTGEIKDITKLGVEAPDEDTIVIHLKKPTPYFEEHMTQNVFYIVPRGPIEKYGNDWTKPENIVTNGAYTLKAWNTHESTELVKNPYYWDAENVQIDRVFFYPIDDIETAFRHFRSGELDLQDDAPAHKIGWIRENMPDEFFLNDQWVNYYYTFNLEYPPFQDIRVRKALSMVVDRETIANNVLKFGYKAQYSFCPVGFINYEPSTVDYVDLSKEDRIAEAVKLLAEAGYSADNPLTFELAYNSSENHEKIAVAIAQVWKKTLGANVKLINTEAKVHYSNLKRHDFQMGRAAFGISSGDAYELLEVFHIGHHFNYGQYKNEKVDSLLARAKHMPNLDERRKVLEEAERLILKDHAVIPLFTYADRLLVSKRVKDFQPNYPGYYLTKFFRLEK